MFKERFTILCVFVLVFSFLVSSYSLQEDISSFGENDSVRVFISPINSVQDSEVKNSFSLKSASLKSVENDFNIIHDFGDYFSTELTKSELESLDNNSFEVSLVQVRELYLTQSVPLINASPVFSTQVNGINITGKGESVCIVDTGVDFNHPDLVGKNFSCVLDCVSKSCLPDCSIGDFNGHGTHIAGIIGANGVIKGVAPGVNLIGIKACIPGSPNPICYDDSIIAGINWCNENSLTYNISVISLSLGGGLYSSFCDSYSSERNLATAINSAIRNNISVVAATGNDGSSVGISSPSCMQNVTRVSSITKSFAISSFSNRVSSFLDIIFAPGTSIYSTWLNNNYKSLDGTSMATPHVSGAIALLNQYKKLEEQNKLTPLEISEALVDSGKSVYDSSSGVSYPVVDVYSALLEIDSSSPKINISSPNANITFCYGEVLFEFQVSDLQLENVSAYVWDSNKNLINQTNFVVSSNQVFFNFSLNLSYGNYSWGVYAKDRNGNFNFSSNYSFLANSNSVCSNLLSPKNNFYSNSSSLDFICESFASRNSNLVNASIYIWNSSDLVFFDSKNISGAYNLSYFNFENFSEGESYSWVCVSYDNSSNFSMGASNYSLYFDFTFPEIELSSPANSASYSGSQSINFTYSVTENNLVNCSLYLNNQRVSTDYSISLEDSFSYSLSPGSYSWKIQCVDLALNSAFSSERTLSISSVSSSGGSGGGSSIKKVGVKNYSISSSDLSLGTTNLFSNLQSAKFVLDNEEHLFVLKQIYQKYVMVEIFSEPQVFYLIYNFTQKVDLNNDKYYDLEVRYLGLKDNRAEIFMKNIHEPIQIKYAFNESKTNASSDKNSNVSNIVSGVKIQKYAAYKSLVKYLVWVIVFLVVIIFLIRLIKFLILYLDPVNRDILKYRIPQGV